MIEGEINPSALTATILKRAHEDALLIVSAVVFRWIIGQRQTSEIAVSVATRIFKRELVDDEYLQERPISFHKLFFSILGMCTAGEQFSETGYGAWLDGLVGTVDQMSERPVVPGRVYTPSTIHGRSDLLFSWTLMLIPTLPDEGDDGVVDAVGRLMDDPSILAHGDRLLVRIGQFLQQMSDTIKAPYENAIHGVNAFSPGIDFFSRKERLEAILDKARTRIEEYRRQRIRELPFDLI
ncbi:MAG: hypothetical protein WCA26_16840, partial [Xanthobacteraceae bacterium]